MLECLKLSQRFLSLSSFFWILFFFKVIIAVSRFPWYVHWSNYYYFLKNFLLLFNYSCMPWILVSSSRSGWMFISSFCSKSLIAVPVSFPSVLVPCIFSFISLFIAFTFSSILWPYSANSVSFLITSVLNCASDKLAICLYFFLELWSVLSFEPYFLSWRTCYGSKGWSLINWPGWGNPSSLDCDAVCGGGSEREHCHLLRSRPAFSHSPATHNQIGPLWCCFPSGWACARSRPLWVSPLNSPMRLGVSPTSTSTPTSVFSLWFEALFPCAGTLGCTVFLLPSCSSWFICMWMWDCPVHNPPPGWVHQLPSCLPCPPAPPFPRSSQPGCPSPPLLPVGMDVSCLSPWLLDFHTVLFSVSSGCCLFLNLLLSFWLCKEAKCVYLCLHLGWKFKKIILDIPLLPKAHSDEK